MYKSNKDDRARLIWPRRLRCERGQVLLQFPMVHDQENRSVLLGCLAIF
jgi:hypothetical protein